MEILSYIFKPLTEDVNVMLQKFHDLDHMVVGGRK
jgi:hypothetical protein